MLSLSFIFVDNDDYIILMLLFHGPFRDDHLFLFHPDLPGRLDGLLSAGHHLLRSYWRGRAVVAP